VLTTATDALRLIRKAKSEAKLSMRAVVTSAEFTGSPAMIEHINLVSSDLIAAGSLEALTTSTASEDAMLTSQIILAEQ
jgi:valyl-tRNA synthetase